MFHVILLVLSLTTISALPISFNNNQTSIQISSSLVQNQIQIIMEINAAIGTQIRMSSKALSQKHQVHVLQMGADKIMFTPQTNEEVIAFNFKLNGRYSLALSHQVKGKSLHFLPLQMESAGQKVQFILPTFNMRMYHIQKNSIFRCHNTLIALNVDKDNDRIYLDLFSEDKKQSVWHFKDTWQHEWRNAHGQVYFGSAHRKDIKSNIRVDLFSGKYCQFNWQNSPKFQIKLDTRRYYTIKNLLDDAPALQLKQDVQMEEL